MTKLIILTNFTKALKIGKRSKKTPKKDITVTYSDKLDNIIYLINIHVKKTHYYPTTNATQMFEMFLLLELIKAPTHIEKDKKRTRSSDNICVKAHY